MIFDDLKNITFYKGIHPNLDKACLQNGGYAVTL
ncbi:beta-galactosidase subunit beta [Streptococcus pneumoniae]|nr:beta-galactosidase subunit beta [Streptococcus pneumoniae]